MRLKDIKMSAVPHATRWSEAGEGRRGGRKSLRRFPMPPEPFRSVNVAAVFLSWVCLEVSYEMLGLLSG